MRAVVLSAPGPVENLQIRQLPVPEPEPGWVRVKVEAFGLNRSELHTRLGLAEGVIFPRVLGIECVGVVDASPDSDLQLGQQVAAMMGGMGRTFDGGYAEYTVVPRTSVIPFHSDLPWEVLGAIPETLQTAYGSLTTGQIAPDVRHIFPGGVDAALELVGTPTLPDTLAATRVHGTVCFTGILSNEWIIPNFYPIGYLPTGVRLTGYGGDSTDLPAAVLQDYLDKIAAGRLSLGQPRVYRLEEIRQAHADMEHNRVVGKLVVRVDR